MITRIPVNPRYPKFHRLSRRDANQMKSGFRIRSGLYEDQIAVSAWGFPPVPKRFPRQRNGLIRNAPSNVNADFVGHPIYWFDEDLAGRIQYGEQYQESEGAWSIRMHYLMQVTGYKKKTYKADDHFDFLKVRRFDDWKHIGAVSLPVASRNLVGLFAPISTDRSARSDRQGTCDLDVFDRKRGRALPGGRGRTGRGSRLSVSRLFDGGGELPATVFRLKYLLEQSRSTCSR